MSTPTYSDLATRFPELATSVTASQTWITTTLAREWDLCASGFWGTARSEATLLRGAHRWALARPSMEGGGSSIPVGALTSESAEVWSRSYAAASNSSSRADQQDFGRTTYGLEYLQRRDARTGIFGRVSR